MEQVSSAALPPIAHSTPASASRHRDERRYQLALILSLAVLVGVLIYGSFATLL
jgi:type VI protein secretion system component VasF